jgi:hypothetical protein
MTRFRTDLASASRIRAGYGPETTVSPAPSVGRSCANAASGPGLIRRDGGMRAAQKWTARGFTQQ